jgi:cruciform cutting endonuclease 1
MSFKLEALTLKKLHRLAVLIGSPCSGTKAVRIQGIKSAKSSLASDDVDGPRWQELSLLSIDMGIRNLAFAHLKVRVQDQTSANGFLQYSDFRLEDWRRVSVSRSSKEMQTKLHPKVESERPTTIERHSVDKESFEPIEYAKHAYELIETMLRVYKPTHVLIERQRFRSGGGSAVQEWSIRVGVFEGMLYSVLRTMTELQKRQLEVVPMQPTWVNRYWLEGRVQSLEADKTKLNGRDVKKAKIDIVGNMLESESSGSELSVGVQLNQFKDHFLGVWRKEKRSKVSKMATLEGITKLDDLSDCLLQGLAWIEWHNNRACLEALGPTAFELDGS